MIFTALARSFLALAILAGAASAEQRIEATPGTFVEAMSDARSGDVLILAPGDYPALMLDGGGAPRGPLTIRAADPERKPVFPALILEDAENVALENLAFRLRPRGAGDRRSFRISGSSDIRLTGLDFEGVRGDEGPWGIGLSVTRSEGVALRDSVLRGFAKGMVISRSRDVSITGNLLHGMRSDGMNFAQVTSVLIEDNEVRDFDRDPERGDHADMIQFWTRGTDAPSTDIVIRRNVLNSGSGLWTQSIFMQNSASDRPGAERALFYRNVEIEGNVILNAHLHGISIGGAEGLTIRNNTVVRNAISSGEPDDPGRWTPQIRVDDRARDVLVLGNVAHKVPAQAFHPDWVVAGNLLVQDRIPGQADHYDRVFHAASPSQPALPAQFVARAGGILDGAGVGAPMLREMAGSVPAAETTPPDAPTADMRGRITFDADQGRLLADGGAGNPLLELDVGGPRILVGNTLNPIVLPREMTAPLYDARSFEITMRVRPRAGYRSAGEVLRLHRALRVWVTGRGAIEVELLLEGGGATRMRSRPSRILRDGSTEFTIAYHGPVGTVQIIENDEIIGEKAATGILPPRRDWGLSFGNPFGTKKSFDGSIETFDLRGIPDAGAGIRRTAWRREAASRP